MAHHQHHDNGRRSSAVQNLLKMLHLSTNTPTVVPLGEDDMAGEGADEPPDDQLSPLPLFKSTLQESAYPRSATQARNDRRESLLTRAIRATSNPPEYSPTSPSARNLPRGSSATSSHSAASMASTAELTSDENLTSPPQSATPSPPLHSASFAPFSGQGKLPIPSKVVIAPATKHEAPSTVDVSTGEAAIEKTLGRKRCIMFACGGQTQDKPKESKPVVAPELAQLPKRKCMLTFACPSRSEKKTDLASEILASRSGSDSQSRKSSTDSGLPEADVKETKAAPSDGGVANKQNPTAKLPTSPKQFHEFGSSNDEHDAWVDNPIDQNRRLTLTDCLRKENAIRKLGEEAEEEADEEEEEQAQDGIQDGSDNDDAIEEDDFAPSDDSSDGGNESDDEEGFADSDDESDAGSGYQFWAPSNTTAATSTENISITHISSRQRSTASSLESTSHMSGQPTFDSRKMQYRRRPSKVQRMRPGTPELPDSTDFVCGTLDEDRPLEAAYIACREQRKRQKHVLVPQDIDPSFPTTDPEDNDDNDEEVEDTYEDHVKLSGIDDITFRGRQTSTATKISPLSCPRYRSPSQKVHQARPELTKRTSLRSPPPKHNIHAARSPPPRRLFGHSPSRLRSPAPARLRSPRGSPTNRGVALGITLNRLAQRPAMGRTSSMPHTPNPFFRNYQMRNGRSSNLTSGAVTPGGEAETVRPEMHVRGPVDIVIGLEKKRQKRKEKFWRQHCRKAAKEQAERKPTRGRGAERMKELGLECAERTRAYNAGQGAQLVISL